jgi:hypothetical protein
MTKTAAQLAADLRKNFDQDLEYAKKRKASLNNPTIKAGLKSLAAVAKRAATVDADPRVSTYVYADSTRVNADITIFTTSLKDRKVASFLSWVESHIAEFRSSSDFATDWTAQRTFSCRSDTLELNVTFSLPLSGDACSRVQTGTTLKEVPTYELRCQ